MEDVRATGARTEEPVDWKRYYQAELEASGARGRIAGWLEAEPRADVTDAIANRAILSFPHTALDAAGPLQAAVVSALVRAGVERVIALGVLHSGGLPAYRQALDDGVPDDVREDGFETVRGAFVDGTTEVETPFGAQPLHLASGGPVRVDRSGLLASEFSLDTFLAITRLAADVLGRRPIPVLPLFVGMTRHPIAGDFGDARALAEWLRAAAVTGTAIVATGDLVHFGTAYGLPPDYDGPADTDALEQQFLPRLERVLGTAMREGGTEEAYQESLHVLKNDQREILPVIAEFLGSRRAFEILHFCLSDYAAILSVAKPCLVASAVVAYGA